ncbi:nitroreductase [Albimonas sp. CAU 1670]|uniref:nitroreductase n=1 Tax=Albimonas sp. CAU 1670 TaxID=3032599 RepID=UPI0023DA940F|nr:nitroreductase [Albimonas sp. CAU 1670]MDF2235266.1 nitroreductase [Albimonas sp. CAU 1670]
MSERPPKPAAAEACSVSAVVDGRRSIRRFLDAPVDRALVEDVVRRAARAPSGSNVQPWAVRIVDGERMDALRAMMRRLRAERPEGEPLDPPYQPPAGPPPEFQRRRLRNGEILYGALGIDRSDAAARAAWNEENFQFFGAPAGVFLLMRRECVAWQWLDLGIYLQTLLLLFEEAGLGTCPQADWAMHGEAVASFLGVDPAFRLPVGVAVGIPDLTAPENRIRTERDDPLADDPDASPPPPGAFPC